MAVAWSSSLNNSGSASQVVLTGGTSGEFALASVHVRSTSSTGVITITPPAGWTSERKTTIQDGSGVQTVETFKRTLAATGSGYTFTYSISAGTIAGGSGQMMTCTGFDTTTPIDTSAEWTAAASGTAHDCPTVTPTLSGGLLVCMYAENGTSGAWTHPTGMTERIDASGYGHSTQALDNIRATGTKTATATTSRPHRVAQSFVIKPAQAASPNGPWSGATFASDSSAGTRAWSNPSNAASSDNSYSTTVGLTAEADSQLLKVTNFGFSIPTGATIDGVVVEVERKADVANKLEDETVKLVKAGSIVGSNLAAAGTYWPTTEAYATYGSSSNLWGTTLTPSEVNASDFGVVLQVWNIVDLTSTIPSVDHIRITVYFSTAVPVTISAVVASADLSAPAPTVAPISPPVASASLDAPAPSVLIAKIITGVAASATLDAPAPTVQNVSPPVASISADAPAPTVLIAKVVSGVVAEATLLALPPTITVSEVITGVVASATATAPTPSVVVFYEYQTPLEVTAHMSATLRQATPTTPDPQTMFVRLNGTGGSVVKGLLGVEHGVQAGQGNEVVHAVLVLTLAEDMPAGTFIFTVKAIDEAWDASTVTYSTSPTVRATTATTAESGLDAGDEVTIDITDLVSESVDLEGTTGQQWFGLELTVNGTSDIVFYGAYSVDYRPKIVKEVSRPPEAPFNLRPTSGLHVGELKPYFAWDFRDLDAEDTLSMIQFQLDTTDDFETASYDSGEVASTTSIFDSNSPPSGSAAFSNLTNGNTYYWRARHADSHGLWSDWSDAQSFTVTTRATLTLDAVPQVPTPTISWTLSVTQQSYHVLVERYEAGSWITHWEQPWTTGTAAEVTLPDSYVLQPGAEVRVTVEATDTVDRASLPGDLAYYSDTDQFTVPEIVFA